METRPTHGTLRTRLLALVLALAFVIAACGQHAEVAISEAEVAGWSGGPAAGVGEDGDVFAQDDLTDGDLTDDENGDFGPGDAGGTQGGEGTAAGGDGAQQGNGQRAGSGDGDGSVQAAGQREAQGSDRTGVTDDTLTFGVHAPVTGAAPLPATSFERSSGLYWRWIVDHGEDALGRENVRVIFRDDRYEPSAAVQVCREMAQEAFLLVGGGGTDQIQACGQYAARANVPYFSNGVTEEGLRGNPWYFASSMSYKQQGELLAQHVARSHSGKKVAMVVTDTPNFHDAIEGWERAVQRHGLDYHGTLRHSRGQGGWHSTYAADLGEAGVEVVYILTAPVDYLEFADQAAQEGYDFQYVGVGITMGLNAVLRSGCDNVDGGEFFSPFPGLDWARQNEPEFFEAVDRYNGVPDDISFALWGASKAQHEMLEQYRAVFGTDLTREDFRWAVERMSVESGIFPPTSYSPDDHFGADQVHLLKADCGDGPEYKTIASFASGF